MTPVFGNNVQVYLLISGVYYPALCGTDCSFKEEKEQVEASTITSGSFKEWRVRMISWSIDVSGLSKINNTDGQIAYFYLLQASVRMEAQTIKVKFTDAEGNTTEINGTCYILNSSITGPAANFANASITFLGTGPYDPSIIAGPGAPAAVDVKSDWWQTVNGNAFINGASSGQTDGTSYTLQNTDVVKLVFVEDANYKIVTGTPTAGTLECKLDLTNHKILFPFTFDGTQRVTVVWER